MTLLSRIFGNRESEILCPHCEETMETGHDLKACARKRMSRRFFFGVMAGAAVAVAVAPQAPAAIEDWTVTITAGPSLMAGNQLLTVEMITRECLIILQNNLKFTSTEARARQLEFNRRQRKIGDTITVRRPVKFVA